MSRVKRGPKTRRRRKKVLKRASGYYSSGSRCYTIARERNDRGMVFAYRDRKTRKREFRKLWIARINALARECGTNYSTLMGAMKNAGVEVDRKILADLAYRDAESFRQMVSELSAS